LKKQPKIIFKPGTVDRLVRENDTTITRLAIEIGVSYSQLWRSNLAQNDKHFNFVGSDLVAGMLRAFPDTRFEEYFDVILV